DGWVVVERGDAESHLAVQEHAVGVDLPVAALLAGRPDQSPAYPHAVVDDGRPLDDDGGARVGEARALRQVLPGRTGLERVVGDGIGQLQDVDTFVAARSRRTGGQD